MSYVAAITDTQTGETREYLMPYEWEGENDEYMWSDGNFGCDCNLSLFFGRAAGLPEDKIDETPCNPWPEPNRFKVVIKVDGEIIYE